MAKCHMCGNEEGYNDHNIGAHRIHSGWSDERRAEICGWIVCKDCGRPVCKDHLSAADHGKVQQLHCAECYQRFHAWDSKESH